MSTIKVKKSELASEAKSLSSKISTVLGNKSSLVSALNGVSNYDGINVSSAGKTLASNIANALSDLETASKNINNYANAIINADIKGKDGKDINDIEFTYEVKSDGSREGNIIAIWNYFKNKGLSDAAICGILGNISAECGFNPAAIEGNGEGHGLIQWSFGRKTALLNAAAAKGVDWRDLNFQLDYLWNESVNPDSEYGKRLAAAGFYDPNVSISKAAYEFHRIVEGSADTEAMIQNNRVAVANSLYKEYKDKVYFGTNSNITSEGIKAISEIEKKFGGDLAKETGADVSNSGVKSNVSSNTGSNNTGGNYYYNNGGSYSGGSYSGGSYSGGTVDSTISSALKNKLEETTETKDIKSKITKIGSQKVSKNGASQETKDILEHKDFKYKDGHAMIGDNYLVTCDKSVGKVGDVIEFTLKNGKVIKCVVVANTSGSASTINFVKENDKAKPLSFADTLLKDSKKIENVGNCTKVLNIKLPVHVSAVSSKAVEWAKTIAADNRYGYVSGGMGNGGYDCTQFIHAAYEAAGISLPRKGYVNQSNIVEYYTQNGFEWHKGPINQSELQPGDVLVNQAHHAEMYIGDGQKVGAHNNYDGVAGDSAGNEISVNAYSEFANGGWDGYLRYVGNGSDSKNV